MDKDFDFFKDLSEQQQNDFLQKYLARITKYLKPVQFPNSSNCYYHVAEFRDDAFHGNSIFKLAALLVLLMKRDFLWPMRFKVNHPIHPATGTAVPYFVFLNWPIGNLDERDFNSFEWIQEDELEKWAKVIEN